MAILGLAMGYTVGYIVYNIKIDKLKSALKRYVCVDDDDLPASEQMNKDRELL